MRVGKIKRRLVPFLVGVILGYFVVSRLIICRNLVEDASQLSARVHANHSNVRLNTLLIAVVTTNQYLRSRAEAVRETWASVSAEVGVDVLFYTGEEASNLSVGDIPIVYLPGVDDTYPPQKKVFKMLQHAHVNYMDNYKWLLRADDDVYIRVKQLVNFLSTINYQRLIYMGQPGMGKPEDVERLKLHPHEHFCMGGPSVLFSGSLLTKLVHHLEYCLQHVVSYNEDVEIGRCISRQLGIQCTWAYDLSRLFYMDYSKGEIFKSEAVYKDKKLPNALTVHAFKKPAEMHKIHQYFLEVDINKTKLETQKYEKELAKVRKFTKKQRAYGPS